MFKVNLGNTKLGSIYAINLPAGITCRHDAPCKSLCYAKKGTFNFPSVKNCYSNNLESYINNPQQAEHEILKQLPLYGFVRVHASGDFVDMEYLKMIIRICKKAKNVKFMAYTKKYELINEYIDQGGKIPSNLKIIFSLWYGLECENPHNFPTSIVDLKKVKDERIKKNSIKCSDKCDQCFKCWNIKKGQQVCFMEH